MKNSEWNILDNALVIISRMCAEMNCLDCPIYKACNVDETCPVETIAKLHAEAEVFGECEATE